MNSHLLPEPAPDETLFSWIVRYHYWSANQQIKETLKYLFDSPYRSALFSHSFARDRANLNHFSQLLGWPLDKVITDFTPYYYEALFNSSYGSGDMARFSASNVLPDILELAWGRRKQKRVHLRDGVALRLCPQCIKDDVDKYGFSYWHRCHQLPGVQACHIHGSTLLTSCATCDTAYCSHQDIKLPTLDCRCEPSVLSHEQSFRNSLEGAAHFARLSAAAVLTRSFPFAPHLLASFYQEQEKKRITLNTNVSLKWTAAQSVVDRFGLKLIVDVHGKDIGVNDITSWIINLHAGRSQPTYRHLLLIGSLFNDYEEFRSQYCCFLDNLENELGTLPLASEVKGKSPLKKEKLTTQKARETLSQLMVQDKNLTRSSLSKRDARLYNFLCTSDTEWFRETLPTKTVRRDGSLAEPGRVSSIEGDRGRLLAILSEEPALTATDMSLKYTKVYKRMLLRDKLWLDQTIAKDLNAESEVQRNDRTRAAKIPAATQAIRERLGKPVKITIQELMKVMGEKREALVGVNSVVTKEAVLNSIETPEDYYSRLADWAVKSLTEEGDKVDIRRIGLKLGRGSINPDFRNFLKKLLKTT